MALTPLLNEAGRKASEFISENYKTEDVCSKLSLHLLLAINCILKIFVSLLGKDTRFQLRRQERYFEVNCRNLFLADTF